jgi:hypothetical protein
VSRTNCPTRGLIFTSLAVILEPAADEPNGMATIRSDSVGAVQPASGDDPAAKAWAGCHR